MSLHSSDRVVLEQQNELVLKRVMKWKGWERTQTQAELLSFIGERALAGRGDELKESTIATEVFGRDPSFDQTKDSVVRVQMHRLRKKLDDYYAREGATDSVRIEIPVGQYVPRFVPLKAITLPAASPSQTPPPAKRRPAYIFAAGVLLCIGIAGLYFALRSTQTKRKPAAGRTAPLAVVPAGSAVRILCGARNKTFVDRAGRVWSGDRFVAGGGTDGPALGLGNRLPEPALLESAHTGDFEYRIPLKPGWYEMRLYFFDRLSVMDPSGGGRENQRVFSVYMNNRPLLSYFDPNSDRGRQLFSVRAFRDVQPGTDGLLSLRFHSDTGMALVNAIEILPSVKGHANPLRICARNTSYTDSQGNVWMPDDFYVGGVLATHEVPVRETSDPELYSTERYGNFEYALPVPPGDYTVNLCLAEHWWGPGTPGGPGGRRVFSIFSEGKTILRDFNTAQEIGPLKAYLKSVKHMHPDASGKIVLDFLPSANYATVHAIEVLDGHSRE